MPRVRVVLDHERSPPHVMPPALFVLGVRHPIVDFAGREVLRYVFPGDRVEIVSLVYLDAVRVRVGLSVIVDRVRQYQWSSDYVGFGSDVAAEYYPQQFHPERMFRFGIHERVLNVILLFQFRSLAQVVHVAEYDAVIRQ